MTHAERRRAQAKLEKVFEALVKQGWRIEEMHTALVLEEPFSVTVTLSIEDIGVTPEKGVL